MELLGRVLLIDDDPFALETLTEAVTRAGFSADTAGDVPAALEQLGRAHYDLVVADARAAVGDGLFERAAAEAAVLPPIVAIGPATMDFAVEAMRAGAVDYLAKPFHAADLLTAARRALGVARPAARTVEEASLAGPARPAEFEELIGRNPRMQRVYNLIRTVAPASSTVLVTGESGTGKERVAEAIHRRSPRRAGPLIRVNCSAFAEGVLESELFGHEQGAFTGAVRGRAGVFRKADRGTLFLDEIGDLPHATQVKLLRAIQEREVQPVGGDSTVPVDVRLIAATNRDLSAEVKAGRFREDLFFRLNVIPIHLPALRERPDDIPPLAEHFLGKFAGQSGKTVAGFTDRALAAMERYGWPGNVRELENAIERAVVLAQGEVIDLADLPPEVRGGQGSSDGVYQVNSVRLSEVEEIIIRRVLARTGWNIKRSAEMLGITRATLYSKIRKFGLAAVR